eukprot:1384527-Amorphochlora_amoeboformis.AAC.1
MGALQDYQPPPYWIHNVELDIRVYEVCMTLISLEPGVIRESEHDGTILRSNQSTHRGKLRSSRNSLSNVICLT